MLSINDVSTMAMATAVVSKEMTLMDHMAAAKSALATAEAHVATLTGTFPDTFLAGVMGYGNQTPDEIISELGKYQREAIVSPQLQSDVYSHFTDLHVCSDVANSIAQYVVIPFLFYLYNLHGVICCSCARCISMMLCTLRLL